MQYLITSVHLQNKEFPKFTTVFNHNFPPYIVGEKSITDDHFSLPLLSIFFQRLSNEYKVDISRGMRQRWEFTFEEQNCSLENGNFIYDLHTIGRRYKLYSQG